MNDWIQLKRMSDAHKEAVEIGKKKYAIESKRKLTNTAKTKTKTAFIGAISEFEKKFGFLWGYKHVTPEGVKLDYTVEQKLVKKCLADVGMTEDVFQLWWADVREQSFNNGMSQVRALENEISQYEVIWGKYNLNLEVKE